MLAWGLSAGLATHEGRRRRGSTEAPGPHDPGRSSTTTPWRSRGCAIGAGRGAGPRGRLPPRRGEALDHHEPDGVCVRRLVLVAGKAPVGGLEGGWGTHRCGCGGPGGGRGGMWFPPAGSATCSMRFHPSSAQSEWPGWPIGPGSGSTPPPDRSHQQALQANASVAYAGRYPVRLTGSGPASPAHCSPRTIRGRE
jgi:hypothetical protein